VSLIGIDIGSSATKAVAWSEDGHVLASHRLAVAARHPRPGLWEVDPQDVWEAALGVLRRVAADPALRRDPVQALAVSASGREVFLADADGVPLTPCVMAADVRGGALAERLRAQATPEAWVDTCGHVPERMDPAVRMLWWRTEAPEIVLRASRVLGWHELLTLRLTGVAACDASLASRWLTYDVSTGGWSSRAIAELELDPMSLPRIASWGTIVGELSAAAAADTGLPAGLPLATGAFDVCSAALGLGTQHHEISVACGTWQAAVVPLAARPAPDTVLAAACTTGAHPGPGGLGVFSLNPDSGSALDWAGRLTGISIGDIESVLRDGSPSPVSAIPWLAEGANGALDGLSLATTAPDIITAIAEAIVYELALRVETLVDRGIPVDRMRATGGGARSRWWMQLFADLLGRPVDVGEPEAGSLGAALLAGVAVGAYASVEDAQQVVRVARSFEPRTERAARHAERLAHYKDVRRAARDTGAATLRSTCAT
jgi:sugar (pentulose or hexulose) kinase